jgi:hypothetical protein
LDGNQSGSSTGGQEGVEKMSVKSVIELLLADTDITALVSQRVWPQSRQQDSDLPAITVLQVSGAALYADDGDVGLSEQRIQVDAWGATYTAAKDLAAEIFATLSAVVDTVAGGVTVRYITQDSEQDLREGGGNSSEYLFRTTQDFFVWIER